MLKSLNYSFRNPPKRHNLSNLPHQTVEKLQKKKNAVLRGPQLGKQSWRARFGILRVNVVCISWAIKRWILLMHGVTMKFIKVLCFESHVARFGENIENTRLLLKNLREREHLEKPRRGWEYIKTDLRGRWEEGRELDSSGLGRGQAVGFC